MKFQTITTIQSRTVIVLHIFVVSLGWRLEPIDAQTRSQALLPGKFKHISEIKSELRDHLVAKYGRKALDFINARGELSQEERDFYIELLRGRPPVWVNIALVELYSHRPLYSFLTSLVEDENEVIEIRCGAIWWLGDAKYAESALYLRRKLDHWLKPFMTRNETRLIRTAIIALGNSNQPDALDLLFAMLTQSYWSEKIASLEGTQETPWNPEKYEQLESNVPLFRDLALSGLSSSGSPRAIRAFEAKEGIPEEFANRCDTLRELAIQRRDMWFYVPDPPQR